MSYSVRSAHRRLHHHDHDRNRHRDRHHDRERDRHPYRVRNLDRGSVTAETALALPVLLVVLAMALWVLACVHAQLRCTDAAGTAARAAARGEPAEAVAGVGRAVGPTGAEVRVNVGRQHVEVVVRAQVRPLGGVLARLPAVQVSGRAVAAREELVGAP